MKLTSRFWPLLVFTFVGYSTVNIKAGWINFISTQFDDVSSGERAKINEGFISGGIENIKSTVDFAFDDADNIMIYKPELGGYHPDYTFYYCGDVDDPDMNFKWLTQSNDEVVDYAIPAGTGFFYWSRAEEGAANDFQLTFAGQVSAKPVEVKVFADYLNMVANPYPQGIDINGNGEGVTFDWAKLGVKESVEFAFDEADNIMMYMPELGGYHPDYTFYFCGDVDDPDMNFKWLTQSNDEVTDYVIPSGAGFWYWRRGLTDMTLPFTSPIAAK